MGTPRQKRLTLALLEMRTSSKVNLLHFSVAYLHTKLCVDSVSWNVMFSSAFLVMPTSPTSAWPARAYPHLPVHWFGPLRRHRSWTKWISSKKFTTATTRWSKNYSSLALVSANAGSFSWVTSHSRLHIERKHVMKTMKWQCDVKSWVLKRFFNTPQVNKLPQEILHAILACAILCNQHLIPEKSSKQWTCRNALEKQRCNGKPNWLFKGWRLSLARPLDGQRCCQSAPAVCEESKLQDS